MGPDPVKLFRRALIRPDPEPVYQFVVPEDARFTAFNSCHKDAGHQGINRTQALLQDRLWWPQIGEYVKEHVSKCGRCRQYCGPPPARSPLVPQTVGAPLEQIHIDFLQVEQGGAKTRESKGPQYLLVVTDHFTRYTLAFPMKGHSAVAAARCLWENFITKFGAPAWLVSDNERAFASKLFTELCLLSDIIKKRTTPYNPQANGKVEWANQTIIRMLGKLTSKQKDNWVPHLPTLLYAYNCTRSSITGYSPHDLMFGRRPRLPVDFYFPSAEHEMGRYSHEYVAQMAKKMREALTLAAALSKKEAGRQVHYYDKKARANVLDPGDQVLVRSSWAVGNWKLADCWLDELHEVVEKFRDTPVYKVRNLSSGKIFPIHCNHLLLIKAHVLQCEELEEVPVTDMCTDPGTPPGGGVDDSLEQHSDDEDWVLA